MPSSSAAPPSSTAARHGTRQPSRDVITDIENALDLQQHKPKTLPAHAAHLHQCTVGRIGSLTRLNTVFPELPHSRRGKGRASTSANELPVLLQWNDEGNRQAMPDLFDAITPCHPAVAR
ncbi:hypothetical protein ACWGJ0_26490 [Streptomyces massasporeus]|uniref:hypothetical protein n=1 Tax=Streptomyces massasporeus TaxID=67324 RepID=UPI00369E7FDD